MDYSNIWLIVDVPSVVTRKPSPTSAHLFRVHKKQAETTPINNFKSM